MMSAQHALPADRFARLRSLAAAEAPAVSPLDISEAMKPKQVAQLKTSHNWES